MNDKRSNIIFPTNTIETVNSFLKKLTRNIYDKHIEDYKKNIANKKKIEICETLSLVGIVLIILSIFIYIFYSCTEKNTVIATIGGVSICISLIAIIMSWIVYINVDFIHYSDDIISYLVNYNCDPVFLENSLFEYGYDNCKLPRFIYYDSIKVLNEIKNSDKDNNICIKYLGKSKNYLTFELLINDSSYNNFNIVCNNVEDFNIFSKHIDENVFDFSYIDKYIKEVV